MEVIDFFYEGKLKVKDEVKLEELLEKESMQSNVTSQISKTK